MLPWFFTTSVNCLLTENGRYQEQALNHLLSKNTRATQQIIEQVKQEALTRKGVMIFASTVDHAREIMGYLPQEKSALIIGDTPAKERDRLISAFKTQQLKFLVNVSVLTTGFDAPHVDLIAIFTPDGIRQLIPTNRRSWPTTGAA